MCILIQTLLISKVIMLTWHLNFIVQQSPKTPFYQLLQSKSWELFSISLFLW
jgi:hypothetical protein